MFHTKLKYEKITTAMAITLKLGNGVMVLVQCTSLQ